MRDLEHNYKTLVEEYEKHSNGDAKAKQRFIKAAYPLIEQIAKYAAGRNKLRQQLIPDMIQDCNLRIGEFLDQHSKAENAVAALIHVLKKSCKNTSDTDKCFGPTGQSQAVWRSQRKKVLDENRAADKKICTACYEPHETSDVYYISDLNHNRGGEIECRQAHEDRIRRETREAVYPDDPDFESLPDSSDMEDAICRLRQYVSEDDIAIIELKTSGLSDREIADELGMSRSKVQAKRAKLSESLLALGA